MLRQGEKPLKGIEPAQRSRERQPAAKQSLLRKLLAVRPVQPRELAGAERLKQTLGAWSLMSIGIGATIGTGVFVLTGTVAANQSGPAITLSLLIAAFGSVASAGAATVLATVALTGFVLNGSNVNLAAVATSLYPTRSRSTGVGWAIGIGRVGAITGSLVGGVLLRTQLRLDMLYPLVGSLLLLAALAMWVIHRRALAMPMQPGLS